MAMRSPFVSRIGEVHLLMIDHKDFHAIRSLGRCVVPPGRYTAANWTTR